LLTLVHIYANYKGQFSFSPFPESLPHVCSSLRRLDCSGFDKSQFAAHIFTFYSLFIWYCFFSVAPSLLCFSFTCLFSVPIIFF
jgi:hypothetical protein